MQIEWFNGPRAQLRPLFELADDSQGQLDEYLNQGRVMVARVGPELIGHLQLIPAHLPGEVELKSLAVVPAREGQGVGRALVTTAIETCRADGWIRMLVSTGAADLGNLRFYQRVGFRMLSIERDAFVPQTGYPGVIMINGIQLRDRVWFSQELLPVDEPLDLAGGPASLDGFSDGV